MNVLKITKSGDIIYLLTPQKAIPIGFTYQIKSIIHDFKTMAEELEAEQMRMQDEGQLNLPIERNEQNG